MIGYHLNVRPELDLRAAGGSWSGETGSVYEQWDGIFLSAELRAISRGDTWGSLAQVLSSTR